MNGAADGCGSAEDAVDLGPIDGLRMGASYRRHDNAASAEKLNNTTVMVLRDPATNASVLSFDLRQLVLTARENNAHYQVQVR